MQAELHKTMSDADVVWGYIVETGIALGKAGKESKPFVDRLRELKEIFFKSQKETLGIEGPDELPQLPSPEGDTEET